MFSLIHHFCTNTKKVHIPEFVNFWQRDAHLEKEKYSCEGNERGEALKWGCGSSGIRFGENPKNVG